MESRSLESFALPVVVSHVNTSPRARLTHILFRHFGNWLLSPDAERGFRNVDTISCHTAQVLLSSSKASCPTVNFLESHFAAAFSFTSVEPPTKLVPCSSSRFTCCPVKFYPHTFQKLLNVRSRHRFRHYHCGQNNYQHYSRKRVCGEAVPKLIVARVGSVLQYRI